MLDAVQRTVRVLAADDHPIARRGVRALIAAEPDLELVAEAADADAAYTAIAELAPDVAVLDLFMPGRPVLELLPRLREVSPDTAVVILTMEQEPAYARRALDAGALGFVLKDGADDDLVAAIRAGLRGERYVNPRLASRLHAEAAAISTGGLSARQLEILTLLALGHTNAQMADRLGLSVRTVENHRAHIQRALAVSDRQGLVAFALSHGLIRRGC